MWHRDHKSFSITHTVPHKAVSFLVTLHISLALHLWKTFYNTQNSCWGKPKAFKLPHWMDMRSWRAPNWWKESGSTAHSAIWAQRRWWMQSWQRGRKRKKLWMKTRHFFHPHLQEEGKRLRLPLPQGGGLSILKAVLPSFSPYTFQDQYERFCAC